MAKQDTQPEKVAQRAESYPYYGLPQCLKLAEAVKDHGGDRAEVPKSVIAQQLEVSEGSAFGQLVAATKTFGMVDGVRTLRLTDSAKDYFFPTTEHAKRLAKMSFIGMPGTFRFLIDRFDGNRLPGPGILANLLKRECRVPESWASRVASMFLSAAIEADAIDAGGFLRYRSAVHSLESKGRADRESNEQVVNAMFDALPVQPQKHPRAVEAVGHSGRAAAESSIMDVWSHPSGMTVEVPATLTMELWDRLKRHVDSLKPIEAKPPGGPT